MKHTVLLMVLVCATASVALAEDLSPPPWDPSLPNQTYEVWQLGQIFNGVPQGTVVTDETWPSAFENPYGEPYIVWPTSMGEYTVVVTVDYVDYMTPEGTPIPNMPTLHIGVYDGEGIEDTGVPVPVSIWIPNSPDANLFKYVFWQMTSDKSPTPTGNPPTTNPPGVNLPTGIPQYGHGSSTWYTYNGMIGISPNPDGEWLTFELVHSTNIEEIVIKTVCAPEPATLGLLGVGGLLAWIRRRKR